MHREEYHQVLLLFLVMLKSRSNWNLSSSGASHNETMGAKLTDYDELNRMFPGHQGIEVVMVGPEVVDGPIMRPPLRAFGPRQRVFMSAHKALYHQFWEELVETQEAARPDLVLGFHPGTASPPMTLFSLERCSFT